jgi:hypothetical protein
VDGGALRVFGKRLDKREDEGCAFILDGGGICGAALRPGSPYCPHHHALCHVSGGGARERRKLREAEVLARAVGGRYRRPARVPPDPFLRRLETLLRAFSRPKCSCIVRKGDM